MNIWRNVKAAKARSSMLRCCCGHAYQSTIKSCRFCCRQRHRGTLQCVRQTCNAAAQHARGKPSAACTHPEEEGHDGDELAQQHEHDGQNGEQPRQVHPRQWVAEPAALRMRAAAAAAAARLLTARLLLPRLPLLLPRPRARRAAVAVTAAVAERAARAEQVAQQIVDVRALRTHAAAREASRKGEAAHAAAAAAAKASERVVHARRAVHRLGAVPVVRVAHVRVRQRVKSLRAHTTGVFVSAQERAHRRAVRQRRRERAAGLRGTAVRAHATSRPRQRPGGRGTTRACA